MLKIVDGLREKPHVTSNDHFGRNEGIVGISDYVLNVGRMFETELISSNELRIYDGEGMIQGCHWRIFPGTYETVTLRNGTQGKKRIDYVVARYEKNSVGYEDIGISVKEGEATSGNPKPPAYITGDIRAGDTIREMVLEEIEYEGINVVEVTPKFKVLMTMAELQEKTDELNRNLNEGFFPLTSDINGIFKHPNGLMLQWGIYPSTAMTRNDDVGGYIKEISFKEAFIGSPQVFTTCHYWGGNTQTGTQNVSSNSVTLYSKSAAADLGVRWLALGSWK